MPLLVEMFRTPCTPEGGLAPKSKYSAVPGYTGTLPAPASAVVVTTSGVPTGNDPTGPAGMPSPATKYG